MMKKTVIKKSISLFLCALMIFSVSSYSNANFEEISLISISKISSALLDKYESISPSDKATVAIWIDDIDMTAVASIAAEKCEIELDDVFSEKYSDEKIQEYIETKREIARSLYNKLNSSFTEKNLDAKQVVYKSGYSPVVLAELTESEAYELSANLNVRSLDIHSNESSPSMDISVPSIESNVIRDSKGYSGSGVKIGIYDWTIPDLDDPMLQNANIHIRREDTLDMTDTRDVDRLKHATAVTSIIVGQQVTCGDGAVLEGVVPDATAYCTFQDQNSESQWMDEIEWLLSCGVNIINSSMTLGKDKISKYGYSAKWVDHIAVNHDVHFVFASGNNMDDDASFPTNQGIVSGGMAYNAIVVGSIDDKNTASKLDDGRALTSSYKRHGATAIAAFKPDLCAPGKDIRTYNNTMSGTSFAAPHVTGVVAQICHIRPGLKVKQDAMKAILLATVDADGVLKFTPQDEEFIRYGAGVVNAYNAWYTAVNRKYEYSYFTPSQTEKTYTMPVSASDTLMRVSLAWIKISKYSGNDHLTDINPTNIYDLANLDLRVYDPNGILVASSLQQYGNVEIAEFEPTMAGNYTIKITQTTPSSYNAYFGVAWY